MNIPDGWKLIDSVLGVIEPFESGDVMTWVAGFGWSM